MDESGTDYGLSINIFTKDIDQALHGAHSFLCGTGFINSFSEVYNKTLFGLK